MINLFSAQTLNMSESKDDKDGFTAAVSTEVLIGSCVGARERTIKSSQSNLLLMRSKFSEKVKYGEQVC